MNLTPQRTDYGLLILQNVLLLLASASLCAAARQRFLGEPNSSVTVAIALGMALLTLLLMMAAWRRDGVWFCWEDVPALLVKLMLGIPLLTAVMIVLELRPRWLASGPGFLVLMVGMGVGLSASAVLPDRLVEWAQRQRARLL